MSENEALVSTAAGATTGGALPVVYVATSGLSGPCIVHSLAVLGSLIGGGMLAGIVLAAGAPIAGGAAGYGLYRAYKKIKDG